jgi:hypothetical protein
MKSLSSYIHEISKINEDQPIQENEIIKKLDITMSKLKAYDKLISDIVEKMEYYELYEPMPADSQAFFNNSKTGFLSLIGKQRTEQLFNNVISPSLITKANSVNMSYYKELLHSKLEQVHNLIARIEKDGVSIQDAPKNETKPTEPDAMELDDELPKEQQSATNTDKLLGRFKKSLQQYVRKNFTTDIETISKLNKHIISAALSNFTDAEKEILQSMMSQ